MKTGNIPENLTFFIRPETSIYWSWKDVENSQKETKVLPCYISDTVNKKTLETGKNWANSRIWNHEKKEYEAFDHKVLKINNSPFRIRIVDLDIRLEGGRAYKVCADIGGFKNLYFDLREDVLLDSIFECGIKKGGEINGEFIFCKIGSQMKPVRIGSLLHKKMIEATKFDKKEKCELVIGGIYSNKKGDKFAYLGQFYSRPVKSTPIGNPYIYTRYGEDAHYEIEVGESELYHVFNCSFLLKYENEKEKFHNDDRLYFAKSHSFKVMDGKIDIPSDYIKSIMDFVDAWIGTNERKLGDLNYYGMRLNLSSTKGYVHPKLEKYIKS